MVSNNSVMPTGRRYRKTSSPEPAADMPTPPSTGKAGRNVLSSLITQIISWGLTLAVTYFLPNYAGTKGMGNIAFANSLAAVMGVAIPLGTSMLLVREVAKDRGRAVEFLVSALLLRFPLGLLVLVAATIGVPHFVSDPVKRTLVLVATVNIVVSTLSDVVSVTLQGQERFVRSNLTGLLQRGAESMLIIGLVLLKAPLWMIVAATGVAIVLNLLMNLSAFEGLRDDLADLLSDRAGWRRIAGTMRYLLMAGVPFLGWAVSKQLYGYTDPLVLDFIDGKSGISTGWYASAFRLIGSTLFVPVAITTTLLPTLTRLFQSDRPAFERLAALVLRLNLMLAAPIVVFTVLAANPIVRLIFHKKDLVIGTIPTLQAGGFTTLTFFVGMTIGITIVASERQKAMMKASAVGALIAVPLCFSMAMVTKKMMGNAAVGAMFSDGLLELVLITMYVRSLPFRLFDRGMMHWLGRYAVAVGTLGGVLLLGMQWKLGLLAIGPAILAYGVACILLGCVDREQLKSLLGSVLKRRAG
ncbi:MAG: oligosaccharide flippase family protein [Capsulimonadales bacterium]|nr:oligosaccharide flippase family protein [Capsulimonadales bacterium]